MAYIRCGGGGIPATLKSDMNAVFNKKFETSTTYPPNTWADTANLMGVLPIRSANGSIAHFTNGADLVPLKSCTLTVTPSQSGTGDPSPTNPRPLNSFSSLKVEHTGANMLDGTRAKNYAVDTFSTSEAGTNTTGDYYTLQAGNPINNQPIFPWLKFKASTQYTLIFKIGKNNNATSTNIRVVYTDNTGENLTRTSTSTDPETAEILVFTTNANKSVKEIVGYYQSGKTYLYYANIGIFEGVQTAQDFATFTGDPHTLDLGATVYGVTGDVVSGELEETYKTETFTGSDITSVSEAGGHKYARIVASEFSTGRNVDCLCDRYKPQTTAADKVITWVSASQKVVWIYDDTFTDLATAQASLNTNPVSYCYPLATPTALTIDPVEVESFKGVNNIWCDKDNSSVAVEYRADIDLLITELGG